MDALLKKHAIHNAVVALGGNVGEVESTLRAAVREIDALLGTQVTGISPLYRTAAWGMADGTPDFLNAVVELGTTMGSPRIARRVAKHRSEPWAKFVRIIGIPGRWNLDHYRL